MNQKTTWDFEVFVSLAKKFEFFDPEDFRNSKEYRSKYLEYQNYKQFIRDKFFYKKREVFFSCVLNFLTKNISNFGFIEEFLKIHRHEIEFIENYESDLNQIHNFSIDKKIVGFASLIDEIVDYCQCYHTLFYDFDEPLEKYSDEFRNSIEIIFLELQEYSKTEHYYLFSNYQKFKRINYQKLVKKSYNLFFLSVIFLLVISLLIIIYI
jgi:hypothetical protein